MGARTKGYIKNTRTGEIKRFLFNPTFSDSRGAKYNNIDSPGSSYPVTQYIGGTEKKISIDLFLYDKKDKKVPEYIAYLENFLPVRGTRFAPPPTLIFVFGAYVYECVLENLDNSYVEFDENLVPTQVISKLSLKVV